MSLFNNSVCVALLNTPLDDYTQTSHIIMFIAGAVLLLGILIIYLYFICKDVVNTRNDECWIWDTISNHCQSGRNYYILILICSYGAIYLSAMYSLEYSSHFNGKKSFYWYIFDLLSNICFAGIGIFPTNYHFNLIVKFDSSSNFKAFLHLLFGTLYFLETSISNLIWTYKCRNLKVQGWFSEFIMSFTTLLSRCDIVLILIFGTCIISQGIVKKFVWLEFCYSKYICCLKKFCCCCCFCSPITKGNKKFYTCLLEYRQISKLEVRATFEILVKSAPPWYSFDKFSESKIKDNVSIKSSNNILKLDSPISIENIKLQKARFEHARRKIQKESQCLCRTATSKEYLLVKMTLESLQADIDCFDRYLELMTKREEQNKRNFAPLIQQQQANNETNLEQNGELELLEVQANNEFELLEELININFKILNDAANKEKLKLQKLNNNNISCLEYNNIKNNIKELNKIKFIKIELYQLTYPKGVNIREVKTENNIENIQNVIKLYNEYLKLEKDLLHERDALANQLKNNNENNNYQILLDHINNIQKFEIAIQNINWNKTHISRAFKRFNHCTECTARRQLACINMISFLAEFLFVVTVTSNAIAITLISNRAMPLFGFTTEDSTETGYC